VDIFKSHQRAFQGFGVLHRQTTLIATLRISGAAVEESDWSELKIHFSTYVLRERQCVSFEALELDVIRAAGTRKGREVL
jgi:hypothetical protein